MVHYLVVGKVGIDRRLPSEVGAVVKSPEVAVKAKQGNFFTWEDRRKQGMVTDGLTVVMCRSSLGCSPSNSKNLRKCPGS